VRQFLWRWGPAILWTAVLFAASSRPSLPVDLHSGTDKLAHFAAYSVLGFLLARGGVRSRISLPLVVLIGILIGALDELYQSTIPNRVADVGDWIADSLGVVAGVVLHQLWWRRGARRAAPEPRPATADS